ncbi:SRPBCC family protein [Phycicoccus avicenniae]|uniref:SRPBCC family protein n=1 Tax=Phycicoccus avicenniae TaxID=2828860 RepID=UPI003D26A990
MGVAEGGYDPVVGEATVEVAASRQRVWDFVTAPESMFFVSDGVTKTFRVPGTPVGRPGEQICVVHDLGGIVSVQMVEVSSTNAPTMFAARWLTSEGGLVERTVLTALDGDRTALNLQLEMIVPHGEGQRIAPSLQQQTESSVRRIRAAIESGAHFRRPDDPAGLVTDEG